MDYSGAAELLAVMKDLTPGQIIHGSLAVIGLTTIPLLVRIWPTRARAVSDPRLTQRLAAVEQGQVDQRQALALVSQSQEHLKEDIVEMKSDIGQIRADIRALITK